MYRKLLQTAKLSPEDINVISMLCKNCESGGLYNDIKRHQFAGNIAFTKDSAAAQKIFETYNQPGSLCVIPADNAFYEQMKIDRIEDIDHVLLVDCTDEIFSD